MNGTLSGSDQPVVVPHRGNNTALALLSKERNAQICHWSTSLDWSRIQFDNPSSTKKSHLLCWLPLHSSCLLWSPFCQRQTSGQADRHTHTHAHTMILFLFEEKRNQNFARKSGLDCGAHVLRPSSSLAVAKWTLECEAKAHKDSLLKLTSKQRRKGPTNCLNNSKQLSLELPKWECHLTNWLFGPMSLVGNWLKKCQSEDQWRGTPCVWVLQHLTELLQVNCILNFTQFVFNQLDSPKTKRDVDLIWHFMVRLDRSLTSQLISAAERVWAARQGGEFFAREKYPLLKSICEAELSRKVSKNISTEIESASTTRILLKSHDTWWKLFGSSWTFHLSVWATDSWGTTWETQESKEQKSGHAQVCALGFICKQSRTSENENQKCPFTFNVRVWSLTSLFGRRQLDSRHSCCSNPWHDHLRRSLVTVQMCHGLTQFVWKCASVITRGTCKICTMRSGPLQNGNN